MSLAGRRYITNLHQLHRSMYMGERLQYYDRRNQAMLAPNNYYSAISDGMQQAHCLLPHRGNMVPFPKILPQHIQGVLAHGRNIHIYRTFHNVRHTQNLSIHCLLLSLEKLVTDGGRIPDVLYYQIDGGTENTGHAFLGVMELLVSRKLAKKIVLTRLPVGHTHEDIDSKFAVIWKRVRNSFVLTPSQYGEVITQCLTTSKLPCRVVDILVLPDYIKYMKPCVDNKFGRYNSISCNMNV